MSLEEIKGGRKEEKKKEKDLEGVSSTERGSMEELAGAE